MTSYLTPGVYIKEVASGARPIQAVGTSTAAFVGTAPDPRARQGEAVPVNNREQFRRLFCPEGAESTPLSHAVFGFFGNGGQRCFVVNVGAGGSLTGGSGRRAGLDLLEAVDEVAIVAAPGYSDPASHDALLTHCETLGDRVAILDSPEEVSRLESLAEVGTAPAAPRRSRRSGPGEEGEGEGEKEEAASAAGGPASGGGLRPRGSDRGFGAFYFPWITIADPLAPKELVNCPPSGHMAGIWARTDSTRGVHKAPANEVVAGALNVTYALTRAEQGELNANGVNCIRFFQREGIRAWGARTLAPAASEWRYLNVRRLFNMVEESIAESTRWVVFEPNDESLWKSIVRDVRAFLMQVWRDGALMGSTPDQAFFVQCDAETNPTEVIDAGKVVTRIGLAPVKPAEFVIFEIGQTSAGAEIANEGEAANA